MVDKYNQLIVDMPTATIDGYRLGKTLGAGLTAKVKLGTNADGTEFAIKIFKRNNSNQEKHILRDLR